MEATTHFEPDEAQIAQSIRAERLRVFNDRLISSAYIAPMGVGLAAWLQYQASGWLTALLWVALIAAVDIAVIAIGFHYRRSSKAQENSRRWASFLITSSGMLGLSWGLSVCAFRSPDNFLLYITVVCILVCVANICMVVMSPLRDATTWFSVGLLVPMWGQLYFVHNPIALQIGLGWLVMLAAQWWYASSLRRELTQQIDTSVRNVSLLALVSEASRKLASVNAEVDLKNQKLQDTTDKLNQLVTYDQLTGVYSRRFIFEELEKQVSVSVRHSAPVSLIMFDLDHFKTVNDTYGHAVGDRALREAAAAAKSQLRDGDMLARIGGEEFLIVLPMTNRDAATLLAERLRIKLAASSVTEGANTIYLPASFGVAQLQPDEEPAAWVRRADDALYKAKANGRNTLVSAD